VDLVNALIAAFFIVMTIVLRFIMMRRNAARRKAYPGAGTGQVGDRTISAHPRTLPWNKSNCNMKTRLTI